MKKLQKRGKIILAAALAAVLIGGIALWAFLPHALNYPIKKIEAVGTGVEVLSETEDSVTIRKKGGGDFRVLLFTDMHLDGKNATSKVTVSHLVENIQREKPDLVLLGGDNVTSAFNRRRSEQLGEIFEKLGVYWAGVLGNHEGDNLFSIRRSEMVDVFASYDHCLMRRGLDSATGDCNYAIHIENPDGTLMQTLYFFDTFDMMSDGRKAEYGFSKDDKVTDGVRADQVAWYKNKAAETKEKYGLHPSVAVLHHPLPQMKTAVEEGVGFLFGQQNEGVCATGVDTGLFAAFTESGSTKTVFCGHDHLNNFRLQYEGILLSYIEPSGYGSYTTASKLGWEEKDWLQGYTKLTLKESGAFEILNVRNSEITA